MSINTRLTATVAGLLAPLALGMASYLGQALPAEAPTVWSCVAAFYLAVVATVYLCTRHYTRRLEELTSTVAAAAAGDLKRHASILTGDEVGRLAGYFNEILHRWRESLRQVSQEKEQLNAVLTSMSDGVLAVDQWGRILLVNRAAREMLALGENEPVGRTLLAAVRNRELDATVQAVLSEGRPVDREFTFSPGGRRVYRVSAVPILGEEGRREGAVLVLRDVTRIRQLEKMRSEFVANVSHELRTPLTSIRGFAETLLEGAVDDPEVRTRFLGIIISEANRLQRLIEDILVLSYLEDRQARLKEGRATLPGVVAEVVALLGPLAEAKGVEMRQEVSPALPPVNMHPDYLRQVMVNLLDNAIKFTPSGGRVEILCRAAGQGVEVEVRDTGIGIPAEALPRLFERFFRVDKARSRELGGTGLGLAIVKHLLERHGGTIWVRSAPGRGSSFTFTVPADLPPAGLPNPNPNLTQS
ncbi:MAG: ATP-binding protein [Clostridia bacterium]|jgi:two-component system phosphate regulon sensor histidine kinase PhoR|nr:cell wall metabolism sensor histidine kinase WalK [Clostridia bacterium]MDH7573377.1 ATP-binding protein [Clostridia bacterium]